MTPTDLEAVRKRVAAGKPAWGDCAALLAFIDTPPDRIEPVREERSAEDIGSWIEENLHQYTGVVRSNAHDLYVELATAILQRFPGLGSGA